MAFLHEHIILPLSDLLTGQHVSRELRFLRHTRQWSDQQIIQYQTEHLKNIVDYAISHVPYYRQLDLTTNCIHNLDDLRLLPIVDKQIIRQHGLPMFTAEGYPAKRRMLMHSSGSTGEPFTYYASRDAYSINTATKLLTWYDGGYRLGDTYMNIKRSGRESRLKQLQDWANHCTWETFYSLDDEQLSSILDRIERKKPIFIRSYPAPIALLARHRLANPQYHHRPKRIFTTGSNLTDETRQLVQQAFGCDVIDSYSCEGTANCAETPAHDGYHISWPYGIVEVLNEHDQPVTNGVGRVVSTDFFNQAQPFIRYDTLDLVEMRQGRIVRIIGHDCETVVNASGKRFTVHSFSGYFSRGNELGQELVTAFQIVFRKDHTALFRLVVTPHYTDSFEREIINHWTSELGWPVYVERVESLPLMQNNKRKVIINENME